MTMRVIYNGVEIKVSRVVTFDRRPVYGDDGTQILYDHYRLGVVGVVNPMAMALPADTPVGGAYPPPQTGTDLPAPSTLTGRPGRFPSESWHPIGDAHLAQRKPLRVEYGVVGNAEPQTGVPAVILESPRPVPGKAKNFTMDDRNGPSPVAFNIMEIHGIRTLVVYFEIETWLQKCSDYPRDVLYHRWEASHDISENYLTTRTVTGRALFSAAMLNDPFRRPPRAPDDFRSTLFHAIPDGFIRRNIKVVADRDGLGVTYSFSDEEQTLSLLRGFNARGVIKLEAFHHSAHDGTGQAMLPVRSVGLTARVWGARETPRIQLVQALVDVAAAYGFERPFNAGWWEAADLHVDLVNKYAELETRVQVQGASLVGLGQNLFGNGFAQQLAFANASAFNTGLNGGTEGGGNNFTESLTFWAKINPAKCVRPNNDAGTRGSYLERLVAQALVGDCAFPPTVWQRDRLGEYGPDFDNLDVWTWGED